jgi:hypothetical protein
MRNVRDAAEKEQYDAFELGGYKTQRLDLLMTQYYC